MLRCIYCDKKESEVTFNGREHVIPRLMGTFEVDLTLKNLVCDYCNSKIFSPLETRFKEDTEEGIYYQMFNLQNSCQIRIRANNVKTTFSSGLGDDFFNEMFPFFKQHDNNWRIFLLPQIKVKRYGDNGYFVFLIDELKKLNYKKFSKIKKLLKGVQSKDVSIFTGGNSDIDDGPLQEAIDLLKKLGIDYKEGKRKFLPIDKTSPRKQFEISMDCTVNKDAARVITKIAFNYFSLAAIQENRSDILFHPNFSKIKAYILGELDLPVNQVIIELGSEPIILEEKIYDHRFIGHTIVFYEMKGNLVSKISFLGKRIYTVLLGPISNEFKRDDFGCGHIFNPIDKTIHQLTQNPKKFGSDLPMSFGLYKRL